jgi:hypothetical protein
MARKITKLSPIPITLTLQKDTLLPQRGYGTWLRCWVVLPLANPMAPQHRICNGISAK